MTADTGDTAVKHVVSVVIPALNEERGIRQVLEQLLQAGRKVRQRFPGVQEVEILVVDDGSTDGTAALARQVERVRVISHERNRGYGAALKTGFAAARGDWLVFLDADGTYPPEFLVDLVKAMDRDDADIILGSRLAGATSRMPLTRRVGNTLFAHLLSWITGRRITDTASGMRIFKKEILPRLGLLPDGLDFTPAMSTAALHEGLDIREIPMSYDERAGRSKLNPVTDGLRFLFTILGTAHRYNPLKVFGTLGLLMLGLALAYGTGPLVRYLEVGRVEEWAIYRLAAVMVLAVAGVNVICFGAVANLLLAAARGVAPFRNSVLGRLLVRPAFMKRLWLIGLLLGLGAVALNHRGLYSYLTRGTVDLHWSYLLAGAMLFLLGLSLMLWGSLVRAVLEIARRRNEASPAGSEQ